MICVVLRSLAVTTAGEVSRLARLKPWEVSGKLWAIIEPLLPSHPRRARRPGRERLDDRPAPQGVLSVLHTGVAWERLPQELGYGSGMTRRRRLNEGREAGVRPAVGSPGTGQGVGRSGRGAGRFAGSATRFVEQRGVGGPSP
ncbi:transposase [Streptosporangium canum]|uniref:transposase n=1 Tax=Streptosporangium canum TaxID=324952 RepID=UPI003F4B9551